MRLYSHRILRKRMWNQDDYATRGNFNKGFFLQKLNLLLNCLNTLWSPWRPADHKILFTLFYSGFITLFIYFQDQKFCFYFTWNWSFFSDPISILIYRSSDLFIFNMHSKKSISNFAISSLLKSTSNSKFGLKSSRQPSGSMWAKKFTKVFDNHRC